MEQSIIIKKFMKSYGQTQILKDISFEAKAGRVTVFAWVQMELVKVQPYVSY